MNIPKLMEPATDLVVSLLDGLRTYRLDEATPCTDHTVRTLAGHLIHWTGYVSELSATKRGLSDSEVGPDGPIEPDYMSAGPEAATTDYRDRAHRAIRAWQRPGALEGEAQLGLGPAFPAEYVAGLLLGELVLHGWDLAKATGQPFNPDPELATAAHDLIDGYADLARQYGLFGPPVAVPATAPALDRALGLSGRDPHWSPDRPGRRRD